MVNLSSKSTNLFDRMNDIIFILDEQTRFTFVNAFALNAWGKERHELLGLTFEEAHPAQATPDMVCAFRHAVNTQQRTELETFSLRQHAWISLTLHPGDGEVIVHARPLPKRTGTTPLTEYDALTSCLTRAAFQDIVETLPLPQTVAIIDLNRLKHVNSLNGHSGGDTHIRTVAHALRETLPAGTLVCRWGGDEFVILTPGTDQNALGDLLDQTNTRLPSPLPGVLAFTVGMSTWEPGTPFDRAFAIADERLQIAKDHLEQTSMKHGEAASFVAFSQELEALSNPDDLIQHALNRLLDLLDFDQAVYAPWQGEDNYVSHQATREGGPPLQPPLGVRVPIAKSGLASRVQHTLTTAWSTDYPSEIDTVPAILQNGLKSVIIAPVFGQGKIIATLILRAMNRWQTITPHARRVVELTALRLEHALELRRAVSEIRSTLEMGMLTLGLILEARDAETHGHTTRATTLCEQLGRQLGLGAAGLDHLRQGAYLHDLGKLSVPDEILRKPGRLTPQEWTVMQGHVVAGHDLAMRIPGLPQGALDVIRSHHERWDGTGYPDALSGTTIPLGARIFAVCDVYDALTSVRPYKEAWTHEEAVAEITRQSGRHFDPVVVQAFLHLTRQHPAPEQATPDRHTST
ncbi:HD domain-containing phosphohydrolase (plasmid) [Deinococcus radiomollis]|uniref:HD domain-containing phosphohydrolase n=1 Tax=Deinococcus radiomollis TaxID=468916 RepID=UPI0038927074